MRKSLAMLIAATCATVPVPAPAHEIPVNTVDGLVSNCTLDDPSQEEIEHHAGICIGFIKGVTNTYAVQRNLDVCLPDDFDNGQLIEAVVSRLRILPRTMKATPLPQLVKTAVETAYPCA